MSYQCPDFKSSRLKVRSGTPSFYLALEVRDYLPSFVEYLACSRHCQAFSICYLTQLSKQPYETGIIIIPINRWGNWGSGRLSKENPLMTFFFPLYDFNWSRLSGILDAVSHSAYYKRCLFIFPVCHAQCWNMEIKVVLKELRRWGDTHINKLLYGE